MLNRLIEEDLLEISNLIAELAHALSNLAVDIKTETENLP